MAVFRDTLLAFGSLPALAGLALGLMLTQETSLTYTDIHTLMHVHKAHMQTYGHTLAHTFTHTLPGVAFGECDSRGITMTTTL